MAPRTRRLALLVVAALAVACLAAWHRPLSRAAVAAALDLATGDRFAFDTLRVRNGHLALEGLRVRRAGEPLLDAASVEIAYSARDLLPGSPHRYGLRGLTLDGARLWIVRRRDGRFNVSGLGSTQPPANAAPNSSSQSPFAFDLHVRNGAIVVVDASRQIATARRLSLDGVRLDAHVDTHARTAYVLRAAVDGDARSQLELAGAIDATRGYALHHLRARRIALAVPLNYVIDRTSAQVLAAQARNLDLRAYAFGGGPYHLSGGADLQGGAMRVPGIAPPITDMRGRLSFFDGGIVTDLLTARAGSIAMRVAGGVYGWKAPAFRLGIVARTSVSAARTLFAFSRRLPVGGGRLTIATLLEGAVGTPLVSVRFDAPRAAYHGVPLSKLSGDLTFHDSGLTFVRTQGRYGAIAIDARGGLDLGEHDTPELAVDARAPAASLPFIAQVDPALETHAVALLSGTNLALDARGVVSGSDGAARLGGLFRLDRRGDGEFGPFHLAPAAGGELEGSYYLERSRSLSGFWLQSDGLSVRRLAPGPRLPALAWLAPPDFAGRLAGTLAGGGTPDRFRFAGTLAVRGLEAGTLTHTDAHARIAGALSDVRLGGLEARGPWGLFQGTGAFAGGRLTLAGAYRGSFERLAALTGDLRATGPVDGPVTLALDARRTVVQTTGAATGGSAIRGVPVQRVAGTLGLGGPAVDVYAGEASVAGGDLALAGRVGPSNADRLGISLSGAQASRLRRTGSPLPAGTLALIGAYGYRGAQPSFEGGLALERASYDGLSIAGNGDLRLHGGVATLAQTLALAGPTSGVVDGRVSGIGSSAAALDLRVRVRDAAAGPLLARFPTMHAPFAGTFDGDVRVEGSATAPSVSGRIVLPEGSYDGLRFTGLAADLVLGGGGFAIRDGRVALGSTAAGFAASAGAHDASLVVAAPAADLTDFDGLFDAGDALAGRGHLRATFERRGATLATSGDVDLQGVRYRNFELGPAAARWQSAGSTVRGRLALGGASGRLEGSGAIVLDPKAPLRRLLSGSRLDARVAIAGLDVAAWLPPLGLEYPMAGRLDADATLTGRAAAPAIAASAALTNGRIGSLPIDRLTLSAASTAGRLRLSDARLELPGLRATGSGSFGMRPADPLDIALTATSGDVGLLGGRLFPSAPRLRGAATVTAHVGGTRSKPHFSGRFDLENGAVRGVALRQLTGAFALSGRYVTVSGAQVAFARGSVALTGSLPIVLNPLGFGPPSVPLNVALAADGIDLSDFAPLLPAGSRLEGTLGGRLSLHGTSAAPQLVGRLAVVNGLYGPSFDAVPLTHVSVGIGFLGDRLTLDNLTGEAGGGTLSARGHVRLTDLVRPQADAEYRLDATASHLYFDVPAFGRGTVDGKLALSHDPGKRSRVLADATLSDAVIPFSAFLFSASNDPAGGALPNGAPNPARDVALNLHVVADRNVRVRSANVDIGGRGELTIGGTLEDPLLDGEFDSTGGTLTYFNTVFRLQQGTVVFKPSDGIIPNLDARATTHVVDPDPVAARNLTGSADIDLSMSGPVTNLSIQLSSNPPYDREQILGLLFNAPAVGATNLFGDTTLVPGQLSQPALPPGVAVTRPGTGEITVGEEAFGVVNAQFTRALLAPVESQIGEALGLTNLAVNVDYSGEVGVTARKLLGKTVDAIYGQSFAYPYRQTFGFEIKPSNTIAAQLTYFQTLGVQALGTQSPLIFGETTNQRLNAQPLGGQSGFSFSLQRLLP